MLTTKKSTNRKTRKLMFHHDPSIETVQRSVLKTISFRILISIMEFAFVYYVTGRARIAFGFIAVSTVYSMILFYYHDRIWDKIKWGKIDPG